MAFRETCAMEERIRMLSDYDTGAFSVTELSERYGVSRETFYCGGSVGLAAMRCGFRITLMRPGTFRAGRKRR